ncbi:efflux transporter outer membrane subunit [Erythrobacter sp. GH1-10]|uniref:efflux transporter outer membrane subunit n=1 Tax=Erythrobacter sp. GH1-10 TaxID=3349334 RepID=UPI003877A4E9
MAIAALGGCATLPQPTDTNLPEFVPPSWAIVEPAPVETSLAQYWTLLDDPLVTEYVERAIANNRDLAAASARVAQARAGVRSARASYLPQVNASGGVQRDLGDFSEDELQFSLGADARWEIDLFGRIGYDVAASREQLRAAGFALADLQRLIVGQVAQTTISARALATQLDIARTTLEIQDENLQIARWRLQAGLVSSLDVEQARTQRAQTAASIPALERDLAASANTISVLIGEAPGPVLAALEGTAKIPAPPADLGYAMPAEVLRKRPDVRQAEANLLADGARVGLARAQLFPLVQLTGNVGTASVGIDGLFDIITGGLIGSIGQLIFDGGRTRARIDGAQAQAEASLANWEQSILLALEDVETAAVGLRAARERVEFFLEALEAAENAAIIARSQYQSGLIDFQALLVAENQLLSARNGLAASEAERATAFVRLTQALGGGWQPDDASQDPSEPGERIEE